MKKYQVIGGQYEYYWYGESDTIRGAKIIASENEEHWDNWQGWHRPKIYLAEDVVEVKTEGYITHEDGEIIRKPKRHMGVPAEPYLVWDGHEWFCTAP